MNAATLSGRLVKWIGATYDSQMAFSGYFAVFVGAILSVVTIGLPACAPCFAGQRWYNLFLLSLIGLAGGVRLVSRYSVESIRDNSSRVVSGFPSPGQLARMIHTLCSGHRLDRIHAYYPSAARIAASEGDALCFACNAINVGTALVLNHISAELQRLLRLRGFDVIQLALDEFLKAGGAAKCLVMKLPSATHAPTAHADPAWCGQRFRATPLSC